MIYVDLCPIDLLSPPRAPHRMWEDVKEERVHRKKSFSIFPSPGGMSLTKLSLGGNYDVKYKLFPPRESLVSDIPAGLGREFWILKLSPQSRCWSKTFTCKTATDLDNSWAVGQLGNWAADQLILEQPLPQVIYSFPLTLVFKQQPPRLDQILSMATLYSLSFSLVLTLSVKKPRKEKDYLCPTLRSNKIILLTVS